MAAKLTNSIDRNRVQIEFSPEAWEDFIELKSSAKVSSNADLVRKALGLYKWYLNEVSAGNKILLQEKESVKEVAFVS